MASGFQPLAISKIKVNLRCLIVLWMYFLIQLQCCFTISFIIHFHLFILWFYHSLVLSYSLWLVSVGFCVFSFGIFSDIGLLCYLLWTIFYMLLVFYLTLLSWNVALFKVSLYTYFTVRFMLFLSAVSDFE